MTSCCAGGELCVHRLAPNMLKVLSGQDSPHFTFDAVVDMGVQQEGVFAGPLSKHDTSRSIVFALAMAFGRPHMTCHLTLPHSRLSVTKALQV